MYIQRAFVPGLNVGQAVSHKPSSSREFAALGNFTARNFQRTGWSEQTASTVGELAQQIVPSVGITVPGEGQ
jgi:hypothetical protein